MLPGGPFFEPRSGHGDEADGDAPSVNTFHSAPYRCLAGALGFTKAFIGANSIRGRTQAGRGAGSVGNLTDPLPLDQPSNKTRPETPRQPAWAPTHPTSV
jgi:hypothetical protein